MQNGCCNKGGFASVYIVVMITGLMFLMLCIIEISSGYAASAITDKITALAGRSVLSEYRTDLFKRYGVYAVKADDAKLSELSAHFLEESLNGSRTVTRTKLVSASAVSSRYRSDDKELYKKQIVTLGTMISAKEALLETDVFKAIEAGDVKTECDNNELILSNLAEEDDDSENVSPGRAEQRREARELRREYRNAVQVGAAPCLLLAGGIRDLSPDAVFTDEYILNVCSNYRKVSGDSYMATETEYILFCGNDNTNIKRVKSSIFWLRMGVDLSEILSDPQRLAEINTLAAAFPAIPLPVAAMTFASIMAAQEASGEVAVLLEGGSVPLIRGNDLISDYQDYLRLFLLLIPMDKKLDRLMHVMESNLDGFKFRDYCCGFDLTANFKKRSYVPGYSPRERTVMQTHVYK